MEATPLKEFKRVNDEIYYASVPLCTVTRSTVEELKSLARRNLSGKARICFHASPEALLHDMLIALSNTSAVRPHMHLNKTEAFQIIEGRLTVVLFFADGAIDRSVELGDLSDEGNFSVVPYCRIPARTFHAVVPLSDTVVFREVTDGPFRPEETVYPSWDWSNRYQ